MFLSFLGWDGPNYFGAEAFLHNGGESTLSSYGYFEEEDGFALPKEHEEFYRHLTHDWGGPLESIHFRAEGALEYTALLYLPKERPLEIRESKDFLDIAHRVREGLRAGHAYEV